MTHPVFFVYSRPGCHLCELLLEELLPLVRGRAEIEIRNIDSRADWQRQYGTRIPVLTIGERVLSEFHLDRQAVEQLLESRAGC